MTGTTEKDAKASPCIGHAPQNTGIAKRVHNEETIYLCAGPACLAWRTIEKFGDGSCYLGYCGVTGKP